MQAIAIDQKYVEYFNRGVKYLNSKRWDKALQFFKKSHVGLKSKEVYLNIGNALAQLDRDQEAIDILAKAADPRTPYANGTMGEYDLACNNLGLMKYRVEDLDGAIELYTKAIKLGEQAVQKGEPFNGDPVWNYANAYLRKLSARQAHDWNLGWGLYEYRFNRKTPTPIDHTLPRWDCFSYEDTIVVLSEQGLGDKIQFARYLPLLKNRCRKVVVQIPTNLNPLFEPEYEVTESLEAYKDCKAVPFCDLAKIFGWDSVPAEWLDMTKFTPRTDLGENSIIVEWSGNIDHANNRNRSTTPEHFLQLQRYGNLYSFREKAPKGITALNTVNSTWIDSCNAILGTSIMVTVDTSVVHMCGTLGHPCIMIQPLKECDWRWGTAVLGTENLWYPSVKVVRNPNNWKKAFDEVHRLLEEHFAKNKQT